MRKTLVVAIREYNAAVRTKAFILSLVLMPVLMGGSIVVQMLLKDRVDITDRQIALVDRSGELKHYLTRAAERRNEQEIVDPETGKQVKPKFVIDVVAPNAEDPQQQRLELSDAVRAEKYYAFVEIPAEVLEPGDPAAEAPKSGVAYYSNNPLYEDIRTWLFYTLNAQIRRLRFAETNIDQATVDRLSQTVAVANLGLATIDEATGEIQEAEGNQEGRNILVPMALMMLMFMMIMMGAMPLVNAVLEEKMQRIAEVLLGSVPPFTIMMGKLLGTVGVSLTVVAVYIVGAIAASKKMNIYEYIPWDLLPWFFAYQVAAVLMFGAIFVAIGSACNDLKEAQSLMTPVWLLVCAPMFVWFYVIREPMSTFAVGLSLFPPCTPMLMLMRQATPVGVPAWQPWVGLAGVIAFTVLSVWIAGRIFRVGILMQGKPPRLSDFVRWAVRG